MENFVSINHVKENVIEFDVSVQGVNADDMRVWFIIKCDPIHISLPCTKLSGDKWECKIPPIPFVKKTAYPCVVAATIDGYYFEPMTGTCDIVGSAELYTQNMSNVTYGPASNKSDEAESSEKPKVVVDEKPKVKSAAAFADEIIKKHKEEKSKDKKKKSDDSDDSDDSSDKKKKSDDSSDKKSKKDKSSDKSSDQDDKKQKIDEILGDLGISVTAKPKGNRKRLAAFVKS